MTELSRAVSIAPPTLTTQAAIWRLAHQTDNSNAYLLWCSDYFDQSLIAWIHGELAGFVIAGELRSGSTTAKILDIAVSGSVPRHLVVPPLLDQLVGKLVGRGISHIESTFRSTDSELCTDLRALAGRWHAELTVNETVGTAGGKQFACVVGPLRKEAR